MAAPTSVEDYLTALPEEQRAAIASTTAACRVLLEPRRDELPHERGGEGFVNRARQRQRSLDIESA